MRTTKAAIVKLAIILLLAGIRLAAQVVPSQGRLPIQSVGAINMTVSDLGKSVKFYSQVLSFRRTGEYYQAVAEGASAIRSHTIEMRLGDEAIELTQYSRPGMAIPTDSRSNDLWFQHIAIIVSDMDRAYGVLQAHHVEHISPYPQRLPEWNKNAAGIRAFYFQDPDRHPLEVLWFPPDKGRAKWHGPTNNLFLGIDHTAITVSDTEQSVAFYRDLLGMRVAGESDNYGPEQEKLNNVAGAHLRITSLRAASGPGIELLEYIAPRGGRNLSHAPRIYDLVHRHTTVVGKEPATVSRLAPPARIVEINADHHQGLTVIHDPDGHELLVRGN